MYKIWLEGIFEGIFYHRTKNEWIFEWIFIIETKTKGLLKGFFIIEIKTKGFPKGFLELTKPPCFIEMHYLFCIF